MDAGLRDAGSMDGGDRPYVLDRPSADDVEQLFAIDSDPRVWTHLPSGRMTTIGESEEVLARFCRQWELDGIGFWMVRQAPGDQALGYCGVCLRGVPEPGADCGDSETGADGRDSGTGADGRVPELGADCGAPGPGADGRVPGADRRAPGAFWNLAYRFRPEAQGKGLATAVSREAIAAAAAMNADLPVVAYLLEHNTASASVARKLGLELVHRAPDAGNPDPAAIRLVFADRELTPAQLDAILG